MNAPSVCITIEAVKTKRQLTQFIKFPWIIYRHDPYWVPPLLMDRKAFFNHRKNPFHKHAETQLFIAYKDNKPAGVIGAAINHRYNVIHNDRTGFFGFFECIKDPAVAGILFDTAAEWLKNRGMETMRGPMNYTTHDPCGLLIHGFDSSPTLMLPYNTQYYCKFFNEYGFTKNSDLYAYSLDNYPEKLSDACKEIYRANPDLRIIRADRNHFMKVMEGFKQVYNESMKNNWGYTPFSDEEFAYATRNLKMVLDPDLTFIAQYGDEVAAYILLLPDYNAILKKMNGRISPLTPYFYLKMRKNIKTVRAVAMAVKEEYRDKRIAALLYLHAIETSFNKGYKNIEASWIHEQNSPMNFSLKRMGFEMNKTYRIYDYRLS